MTIDINKAKSVIATLERDKQEQRKRLQLAAEAKHRLENTLQSK